MIRIALTAISLFAMAMLGAAEKAKPETVPVILEATCLYQVSDPPALLVKATGQVKSLGYTEAKLTRATYVKPPKDGVQDYTLTAVPPAGIAGQALSDVSAEDSWKDFEKDAPWLKGVRIHGTGQGVKTIWLKSDVVVGSDDKAAKANVGQVIEVQMSYGVFPPFPSDFAVTVDGKAVPFNGNTKASTIEGKPVVGASLYSYYFQATGNGKQNVTVSFKRGTEKTEKSVELNVGK